MYSSVVLNSHLPSANLGVARVNTARVAGAQASAQGGANRRERPNTAQIIPLSLKAEEPRRLATLAAVRLAAAPAEVQFYAPASRSAAGQGPVVLQTEIPRLGQIIDLSA